MLRIINICLVVGLVALACVIYQVKYQARGLDADIKTLSAEIDDERDAIALLRAEWSLLNRPERIERLAQKYLKLAPARPVQIVTLDEVTDRDFDPARLEQAAPQAEAAAKSAPAADKPNTDKPKASVASAPATAPAPWPEAKIVRPAEAAAE